MPSTGTPASYRAASMDGAWSTCTDAGPPERMIPFGRRASISDSGIVRGTISEYTCASRTRRAISCAYCAPKSTTSTVSKWDGSTATASRCVPERRYAKVRNASAAHADTLAALEALAFGLQRGGHHDLGLLELLDRLVAGGGHRGAQGAEQVEGPVVLVGRADENLVERAPLTGVDARAAGKVGMERRHPPVEPAARRLVRAGERGAEHHRVGAAGDRLGDVAAGPHAAVRDHVHVDAGLVEVADASAGGVGDRSRLRHADSEDAAGRALMPGTHADEDADRARPHEMQRGRVRRAAADDDRQIELADELLEVQRLGGLGDVLGGHHRPLDDQDVELGVEHELGVALDALRRQGCARDHARRLDLLDAGADQLFLDRLRIYLLEAARGLVRIQRRDLLEELLRILVPRPQALEVEAAQAAQLPQTDRGRRRRDTVHRRRHEGKLELERVELPGDVDVLGISRPAAGDDGDVVEPVGSAPRLADPDLDFHFASCSAGKGNPTARLRAVRAMQ